MAVHVEKKALLIISILSLFVILVTTLSVFLFHQVKQYTIPPIVPRPSPNTFSSPIDGGVFEFVGTFTQIPSLSSSNLVTGTFVLADDPHHTPVSIVVGSPQQTITLGKYSPDTNGSFSHQATFTPVSLPELQHQLRSGEPTLLRISLPKLSDVAPKDQSLVYSQQVAVSQLQTYLDHKTDSLPNNFFIQVFTFGVLQ